MSGRRRWPPTPSSSLHAERDRALLHAFASGIGLKFLTVVVSLTTVPLVIGSLGKVQYGVFVALTSLGGLLAFSDLGIGGALATRLAAAKGSGDVAAMRSLVAISAFVYSGVGVVFVVIGAVSVPAVPWASLLGVPSANSLSLKTAAFVFLIGFGLAIPAGLGQRVLGSLQRGTAVNLWNAATVLLIFGAVVLAHSANASLPVFVAASVAPTVVVGVVQSTWVFGRSFPELRPRWAHITRSGTISLGSTGGAFMIVNIAQAVSYQTDTLVVSSIAGAAMAAVFGLSSRLFQLVTQTLLAAGNQLWPAMAEAISRGHGGWVRSRFARAMALNLTVTSLASVSILVGGQAFIRWWVGEPYVPTTAFLVLMTVWTVYGSVMSQVAFLLSAAQIVRPQLVMSVGMAILNLPLSIIFTHRLGLVGPVLGSLVAHLLFIGGPATWFALRVWRNLAYTTEAAPS